MEQNHMSYTPEMNEVFHEAIRIAQQYHHQDLTYPHLLHGLLRQPSVQKVLATAGANLPRLLAENEVRLRDVPVIDVSLRTRLQPPAPSSGFQKVCSEAALSASHAGRMQIRPTDMLMALYRTVDSELALLLEHQNIREVDLKRAISHGLPSAKPGNAPSGEGEDGAASDALSSYAVDLNAMAAEGRLDPLVGRDAEVQRTVHVLCRRRKNNPLYVGDPGVGKTALAEGLAQRIIEGNVPEPLKNARLFLLDLGSLVAGTKYRGDFEKRLKRILAQVEENPDYILVIDEIHTIIGAGSASNGTMDASNLIKPALSSGKLRVIGATTFTEYRRVFAQDRALSRRFQTIDVGEPSPEETVRILEGVRERMEKHHAVKYSPEALSAAVHLSVRHMPDRLLPDKAIDVMDEAGAWQRVCAPEDRHETITEEDVGSVVARLARLPEEQVVGNDRERLRTLPATLRNTVFGQDGAIDKLSHAVKMSRAGLRPANRPVGSFLFAGPTGVGKTEVTRQLAEALGLPMLRFDMSEYMEQHAVARLIGAPPGYVGHDKGGQLTEAVSKQPAAVLLLDEIEKAHPDIYNVLLQVMDNATLTDGEGRVVRFNQVIVVMTTNAGAQVAARRTIGFTHQDHTSDAMEVLQKTFTPEFRNRLDAIVMFAALDRNDILRVVDKQLLELTAQLGTRHVVLDVKPAARHWLAEHGFDPQMGARPMARLLDTAIRSNLADELLFGTLVDGGTVTIDYKEGDEALSLSFSPATQPELADC